MRLAIDDFDLLTELKITYDESIVLSNGKSIKPEETLVVPNVWFEAPSNDTEYTLAMVPDKLKNVQRITNSMYGRLIWILMVHFSVTGLPPMLKKLIEMALHS